MSKKTLVFGASLKETRYSNMAIHKLLKYKHKVVAYGLREGNVFNVSIDKELKSYASIDTITIYMNPQRQHEYYDYLVSLKPNRVLFNPGTENPELYELLVQHDIAFEEVCTLVLLSTNQY